MRLEKEFILEDALDDDYIRDMNNTDDFSALDSEVMNTLEAQLM